MSRSVGLFLASAFVLSLGNVAKAGIIYDNLSASTGASSGGDAGIIPSSGGPLADTFSTGGGANSLSDVKLLLRAVTPADGGSFLVSLFSNNPSGPVPGSSLTTLAIVADSSLATNLGVVDFNLTTPFLLSANTRYWIELSGTTNSARWSFDSTNVGVGVANEYNYFSGSSFANSAFTPYQMQVTVTPSSAAVPEPSSFVLCGIATLAGLGAAARRRKRAA